MTRAPHLRDVADMPQFREREPPLPMRPVARCCAATMSRLPRRTSLAMGSLDC
jgi:hypothetical protein